MPNGMCWKVRRNIEWELHADRQTSGCADRQTGSPVDLQSGSDMQTDFWVRRPSDRLSGGFAEWE